MEVGRKAAPAELDPLKENLQCRPFVLLRILDDSDKLIRGMPFPLPIDRNIAKRLYRQTAASESGRKDYGVSRIVGYFIFTSL